MTDTPQTNCLHCKLSYTVLDHLRAQQGLDAGQKPRFQARQIKEAFDSIILLTADILVPNDPDADELLERMLKMFNEALTATCERRLKSHEERAEATERVH